MGTRDNSPFAYANSSFFRSWIAGSSLAMSSEELLVLERRSNVRREQALYLLLSPYLCVLRCLPQCPKSPPKNAFLVITDAPY